MIRHRLGPRPSLSSQPERYGPIVRQGHLHIGAESAASVGNASRCDFTHERVEQRRTVLGGSGFRKPWPQAAARIGGQRELRDEQHGPAHIAHAAIHLARGIREHAIGYEACREPARLLHPVFSLDSNQYEQTWPNFSSFLT